MELLSHQNISVTFMGEMQMFTSNNLFIWKHGIIFPDAKSRRLSLTLFLLQTSEKALMVTGWTVRKGHQQDIFFCQNDNIVYNYAYLFKQTKFICQDVLTFC